MSGYIGTKSVTLSTTTATVGGDSTVGGDLTVDTNTLYVDSTNNNVGIGTSSPARELVINGGTQSNIAIQTDSSGAATTDGFQLQADSSHAYIWNYENTNLLFATNNAERMRIVGSSGNVGIGTTSPTSTASAGPTLEISGTAGGNLVLSDSDATTGQRAKYFLSQGGTLYVGHSADNGTSPINDLVIDASGDVGIGTTTVNRKLEIAGNNNGGAKANYIRITDTDTTATGGNQQGGIEFYTSDSGNENVTASIENLYAGTGAGSILTFNTSASGSAGITERFRVDHNGNITFGSFNSSGGSVGVLFDIGGGTSETEIQTSVNGTATRTHYKFINNNGAVGTITTNGSTTAFNTSSDYRLKENVTDVTDGITRVKQLEPKRFNFIVDPDTTVDGFIAHQVQEFVPEAVTGTHNEVDDDGNAVMQGIDQSKLVPLLTAALKESIAKIEALEARVTALEGN